MTLCPRKLRWLLPLGMLVAGYLAPLYAHDLTKSYAATLEPSEPLVGREWSSSAEDVWTLSSFRFAAFDQLEVQLGPSTVVFGVAEKNVVWAAVFPKEPGSLRCAGAGNGERIRDLWLRFHPRQLGELFPAKTVGKRGAPEQVAWAKRMCAWKLPGSWQAKQLPAIPQRGSIVVDCDTVEGQRRFFAVDQLKNRVEAIPAFDKRALPALIPMEPAAALQAYDAVVAAFDAEYAKFGLLPKLDWKRAAAQQRPLLERATSTFAAAVAIDSLVSQLCDLHVWTKCGDEFLQGYSRPRPLNGNFQAVQAQFGKLTDSKHDFHWAITDDGVGYVLFYKLGDPQLPAAVDQTLETLASCWALIIDLRFNGGGDERLAREVAARFVDKQRVYSLSQYRNGPQHSDLGPPQARTLDVRGPWRFEAPVVCLQGQVTFSSAESMALMFAQCPQVTTMGDRTGGSSANPRLLELEGEIVVNLPRWNAMDPQGKAIEHVGVAPQILVDAKPTDFGPNQDPVLQAALAHLRKIPSSQRQAGKR